MPLLCFTDGGIFCEAGGFYIDPWRKVNKAIVTHAHSDHARWGMNSYLCHEDSAAVMRLRLGANINVETLPYHKSIFINGIEVSLYPAGHIPGSAQVRVAYKGEVWVVSGDYKLEYDGLSPAFEPVTCHTFITECTFGLPIYRWKKQEVVFDEINQWWVQNKQEGKVSVLACYSLGKAQRLLQNVGAIGPIFQHGAIHNTYLALRESGFNLRQAELLNAIVTKEQLVGALVLCPPSALSTPWMKKLEPYADATASGWMTLRGIKRRQSLDRGFVISDHADWIGLNSAIAATGCENVVATHGYTSVFSAWLQEQGLNASEAKTEFSANEVDVDDTIVADEV